MISEFILLRECISISTNHLRLFDSQHVLYYSIYTSLHTFTLFFYTKIQLMLKWVAAPQEDNNVVILSIPQSLNSFQDFTKTPSFRKPHEIVRLRISLKLSGLHLSRSLLKLMKNVCAASRKTLMNFSCVRLYRRSLPIDNLLCSNLPTPSMYMNMCIRRSEISLCLAHVYTQPMFWTGMCAILLVFHRRK